MTVTLSQEDKVSFVTDQFYQEARPLDQKTNIYKDWPWYNVFLILVYTLLGNFISLERQFTCLSDNYSACSWIKGTDAHREAAPASEIHPVTYGTGLPLRFFPSVTVNEGIFSFSRIVRGKCSFWTHLSPAQYRRAHSSIFSKDFLVSRFSHRPSFTFDHNVQQFLFLSLTSGVFWFEFLYVFRYTFYEPEAQIGVYCLLKPLEFIIYLFVMVTYIDHSASKFHVCVCVSV